MSVERDRFEALVAQFSDAELRDLNRAAAIGQYALEPVWPTLPEMSAMVDSVLKDMMSMPVPEGDDDLWYQAHIELAHRLIPELSIKAEDEVVVEGARSFMVPGRVWALDGRPQICGKFFAMTVDAWVDLPYDDAGDDPSTYPVSEGLHVVVDDTQLVYEDNISVKLGLVSVPLNHGYPALYRVLRSCTS